MSGATNFCGIAITSTDSNLSVSFLEISDAILKFDWAKKRIAVINEAKYISS